MKEKMEGLSDTDDLAELKRLKHKIRAEMIEEGFDADEASDFVDRSW